MKSLLLNVKFNNSNTSRIRQLVLVDVIFCSVKYFNNSRVVLRNDWNPHTFYSHHHYLVDQYAVLFSQHTIACDRGLYSSDTGLIVYSVVL